MQNPKLQEIFKTKKITILNIEKVIPIFGTVKVFKDYENFNFGNQRQKVNRLIRSKNCISETINTSYKLLDPS